MSASWFFGVDVPDLDFCVQIDSIEYHAARNLIERFRGFFELISRFEFEFCRCENYFFEGFEFLVFM